MAEDTQDEGEAPEAAPKPKSKKKLIIIGAAAAVLALGGGGAGFMMLSGGGEASAEHGEAAKEGGHGEASGGDHGGGGKSGGGGHGGGEGAEAYVDVPAMMVNLRSPDGAARFLKVHFMLVPGPKGSVEGLKEQLPVLLDAYQPFLRELRPEDLAGSAAVFRIKEEMLVRARDALGAGAVEDILIQDLVQQ